MDEVSPSPLLFADFDVSDLASEVFPLLDFELEVLAPLLVEFLDEADFCSVEFPDFDFEVVLDEVFSLFSEEEDLAAVDFLDVEVFSDEALVVCLLFCAKAGDCEANSIADMVRMTEQICFNFIIKFINASVKDGGGDESA